MEKKYWHVLKNTDKCHKLQAPGEFGVGRSVELGHPIPWPGQKEQADEGK